MIILNRNVEMLSVEDIIDDSRELNIDEATEYILAIPKFAEKIGTENLKLIMERLGDPQDKVRAVHVAGTNGKGSTTEMLRLMLTESGFRTGSFTSPHLVKINERISIDGRMISDEEFILCFRKVMKAISDNSLKHPSFFEFIFAIAVLYFAEQGVDFVVYETGMGGRLDATNIITPVVSVITSIGMDHMQYLGDTIEKIAYEKAGIIKPGVPVIHNAISHGKHDAADSERIDMPDATHYENGDVLLKKKAAEVISQRAEELSSELYLIDRVDERVSELSNPVFYTGYQKENASTAIKAFEVIRERLGEDINGSESDADTAILRALNKFIMPARMEKLGKNVIIDGAHNTDAMPQFLSAAAEMIKREMPERVYFIFAVSNDKDYRGMVRMICDAALFDEIFITTFNSYRKTEVELIREIFEDCLDKNRSDEQRESGINDLEKNTDKKYRPVINVVPEVKECLNTVFSRLGEKDLLFTAGSLYLAGEIEAILK